MEFAKSIVSAFQSSADPLSALNTQSALQAGSLQDPLNLAGASSLRGSSAASAQSSFDLIRSGLPESFSLKGDLTNVYVGDFNGDGKDDFLRQEKGYWDDDNSYTAEVYLSNGNGSFNKVALPERFQLKGDFTNLHIGDFNGDGKDDILRQEKVPGTTIPSPLPIFSFRLAMVALSALDCPKAFLSMAIAKPISCVKKKGVGMTTASTLPMCFYQAAIATRKPSQTSVFVI